MDAHFMSKVFYCPHRVAEMNVLNDLKYSIVHSPVEVLMYCPVVLMYCAVEVLMLCKLLIMREYPVNDDQCVCVCEAGRYIDHVGNSC